ncbi:class I SAM-dependent methyltransferase [Desulfovibrio desulfuricans]|uniref:class I SAM-dependent methyltransferase n=1 Tax=Desulfovibrio desulfuricans TaxID=876 RepID=UPI003984590D
MRSYFEAMARKPEFFGISRYCNICGYRFAKFSLFNNLSPREAQCPICGSLERHRHLFIHIASIYPFLQGKSILHFAPEQILKEIFLSSQAEYYDADIDPEKATYQIDITKILFNDNKFDYVFCTHVLEHIVDDLQAMKELYRVLKFGGTAYLCVPFRKDFAEDISITDPKGRERFFGQHDHVRYYNLDVFCDRLKSVGFNTEKISTPAMFPSGLKDARLGDTFVLARKL